MLLSGHRTCNLYLEPVSSEHGDSIEIHNVSISLEDFELVVYPNVIEPRLENNLRKDLTG